MKESVAGSQYCITRNRGHRVTKEGAGWKSAGNSELGLEFAQCRTSFKDLLLY